MEEHPTPINKLVHQRPNLIYSFDRGVPIRYRRFTPAATLKKQHKRRPLKWRTNRNVGNFLGLLFQKHTREAKMGKGVFFVPFFPQSPVEFAGVWNGFNHRHELFVSPLERGRRKTIHNRWHLHGTQFIVLMYGLPPPALIPCEGSWRRRQMPHTREPQEPYTSEASA